MSVRDFCIKYIVPVVSAVLAIFSYSYYQQLQEAKRRAQESNKRHNEQLKEVEVKVEDVKAASEDVREAVKRVEEIKPVEVKVTATMQESIDDFNK